MPTPHRIRDCAVLVLPLLLLLVGPLACSDDDKGTGPALVTPSTDLTGSWFISEVVDATACGEGILIDSYTANVTQSGNGLTVVINGLTFTGTISGSTVAWTGSYPDQGGTTTITSMNVTVNAAGDELSGTATWSWTDGVDSCAGTTGVDGVKL